MKISDKIRQQRKLNNISQDELSKKVGVSLKTVQRWESGERSPRIEEINKLAESLNISVGYLVSPEATPEQSVLSQKQSTPTKENSIHEKNTDMAFITLKSGEKVEAPATPEGYAFLEKIFALSLGH